MLTRPTLLFGGVLHHPDRMLLEHALAHICNGIPYAIREHSFATVEPVLVGISVLSAVT